MKVYDCFTFYNELDLLEYRFEILYPYVDSFVIVEATKTYVDVRVDSADDLPKLAKRAKKF